MKRMTRVINEDRKTGRRRRSSKERDLDFVLGALTLEMFDCEKLGVLPGKRERTAHGKQSRLSGEISNYRGNLFSLPFSEYAIGKRHAFSRRLRLSYSVSQIYHSIDINF